MCIVTAIGRSLLVEYRPAAESWKPMNANLRKEQFSIAYIRAVASKAGYQVVRPEVDDDSVDGVLMGDFGRRPRVEFQAKATSRSLVQGNEIRFPLPRKNYDDLRADTMMDRILIVTLLPEEEERWISQTRDELCLRHCAYWLSLKGEPMVRNTCTITISIPMANMFGSSQLADLMDRAEQGVSL